ncbi:MAG TPA: hypothetical protein VI259_11255 [Gemmatimonadaceae bacterium]
MSGTLQLNVAQAARVDCSNGGTLVTVAGNGASYLVVPQFPVDLVANALVPFRLTATNSSTTAITTDVVRGSAVLPQTAFEEFRRAPNAAQQKFDRTLRARARANLASGAWRPAVRSTISRSLVATTPDLGSVRSFRVLAKETPVSFRTVGAQLIYAGANVLLYMDTTVTPGAFSAAQIQAFGSLFDQTLYPIDTAAFGPPSDVDGNGHVIMLMSPVVNALTSKSECQTNGFIGGFFEEEDLGGSVLDPNSNHGEVFYSIAPDPNGVVSCTHTAADVGFAVSAVFMHELQHLINFSQHVVVHGGDPEFGWLDEGLSIVAEELGSLHYEQQCPGTSCRTNPAQIFPDSSQGFVQGFLYDSYQYALRPDTASVTLHSDSDDGFSWRGGDWLLVRWLGDQFGNGVFRKLDQTSVTGVANIQQATAQSFPPLFADFGLALVTDSLPGLPRTTAAARDRFVTRNVRQLWARLFVTSGGSPDVPLSFPIVLKAITSDSTAKSMDPGTSSYFRLDTPQSAGAVTLKFSNATGGAISTSLKPQLAIFRLPPGQ